MLRRSKAQALADRISSPPVSNILVADDMSSTRLLVSRILQEKGHRVIDVGAGDAVLKMLKMTTYNVIFLNLNMPPFRGGDYVESVRANGREARIIVMTSDRREGTRNEVIRAGADRVIHPPLSPKQILGSVAPDWAAR